MKYLCVCRHGNVRSVALAYQIKTIFAQEAIAVGYKDLSVNTMAMLAHWADTTAMGLPELKALGHRVIGNKVSLTVDLPLESVAITNTGDFVIGETVEITRQHTPAIAKIVNTEYSVDDPTIAEFNPGTNQLVIKSMGAVNVTVTLTDNIGNVMSTSKTLNTILDYAPLIAKYDVNNSAVHLDITPTATTKGFVDWGDGTVETGRTSTTIYQHQYNNTGGTWCANLGYWVYKIRIYGATGDITCWKVERHNYTARIQYHAILWAVFGTNAITDYSYAFYTSAGNVLCRELQACTIPTFASVTNTSYMFYSCYALSSITLPASWGSVTNTSYMFYSCYALSSITLPASWGSVTEASMMFYGCSALSSITLPASWGSVTSTLGMFSYCYALSFITLPASWGSVTEASIMFYGCSALSSITLPASWGSVKHP